MSEQPEALRLADAITHPEGEPTWETCVKAAAELRRLHAENERKDTIINSCLRANAPGGWIDDQRTANQELLEALKEIEWSNNEQWRTDRARAAIAKAEGETK